MTVSENSGPILRRNRSPNENNLYTRVTLIIQGSYIGGTPLCNYTVFIRVTLVYKRFSLGGPFFLKIGPEFCEAVTCLTSSWRMLLTFESKNTNYTQHVGQDTRNVWPWSGWLKLISFLIITFQGGGVTTCKLDKILPLFLLYLPIPTRTRSEGIRP